jgi:hypothetical protein
MRALSRCFKFQISSWFFLCALCLLAASPSARAGGFGPVAGRPCPPVGAGHCGDPILLPIGNHFETVTDFKAAGENSIDVTRYYNSILGAGGGAFSNWSWTYDRSLFISPSEVDVQRPDGRVIYFVPDGVGGWKVSKISI